MALLLAILPTPAAFADPQDAPWAATGKARIGPPLTLAVTGDGSVGPAVLEYRNDLAPSGDDFDDGDDDDDDGAKSKVKWSFTATAAETASIELAYRFSGHGGDRKVKLDLDAVIWHAGSTTVVPLVEHAIDMDCCFDTQGTFNYDGVVTLSVAAGEQYGFRARSSHHGSGTLLQGELEVDQAVEFGEAVMVQAVPASDGTFVAAHATGAPGAAQTLEVLSAGHCDDGQIGGDATVLGGLEVVFDERGEQFVTGITMHSGQTDRFAAVRLSESGVVGRPSNCVRIGPDNDAWLRALALPLDGDGTTRSARISDYIDIPGQPRWYRFAIQPGARATIELSGLPADYDVAVFKDIAAAFISLSGDADTDSLNRLGAEFAPSVFSPSVFSPSVFSPSVFSPDAYAPSVFSPSVFSPSVFSPSVFSPSVFSPSVFSPSVFSPSVFSPSVFSPSVFSPSVFSPSVFSPSVFSPETFASAQTRSLIAVGAQAGTARERLVVDTWNNTGDFYIRVWGKDGAADLTQPFQLTVTLAGVVCDQVAPIPSPSVATAGDHATIILWDSAQMDRREPGNADPDIDTLAQSLQALAVRPEVRAAVVDLADYPHIQSLHAQAAANSACPYAENLTARAIKTVIDDYRVLNPGLQYVVLAGSDSQIPFFRYPDQGLLGPEQDYDPPVADDTQSQSALRLNFVLGQDEYGAGRSISLRDGRLPLPELAVGRLVETAQEMNGLVEAYLGTADGVVATPTSTLVTGYDFLEDAANAVQAELAAGTVGARNDVLITAADISPADPRSWTAADLRRELLDEAEDIVFLAGHFSANSTLAADYDTTLLATELDAAPADFHNALIFSAGCHSGYNIVNEHAVPGVTEKTDWIQAFARKRATVVAGTGYQYGDTDFLEYSERLYARFARELRRGSGPVAIGEALVRAKQHYLATTPDLRGLHRKSLLISTLFGLPMLSIDLPGARIAEPPGMSSVTADPVGSGPGGALGLHAASLSVDLANQLQARQVTMNQLPSQNPLIAEYLTGPDGVISQPAEPALPLVSRDVSVPGQSLRGVGFRGGAWTERSVIPLTGAATTELRGVHTPFTSPVYFPMRLATVNYFPALTGSGGTLLHITPAQHRVAQVGDLIATLREFSALDFALYYSDNTQSYGGNRPALAAPPTLFGVSGDIDGPDLLFSTHVVGDPAAGVQGAWITYTLAGGSQGQWQSLDLAQDAQDSTLWRGRLPGAAMDADRLVFIAQAFNGVGLVAMDDNYGGYHGIGSEGSADRLLPSIGLTAPDRAMFGDSPTLTATLDIDGTPLADAVIHFGLAGSGQVARTDANGQAQLDFPVTVVPGDYPLTVSFAGDESHAPATTEQPFTVDKATTTLTLISTPQSVAVDGVDSGLRAELQDHRQRPLLQRTVYFTVDGGPDGPQTIAAISNNLGEVRLGELALPAGSYTVSARFLGTIPAAGLAVLADPVYAASEASIPLDLIAGPDCPGAPSGNLTIQGFCYLEHQVNGRVTITDGTLIVGDGVTISNLSAGLINLSVEQLGEGGVWIRPAGRIVGGLREAGPGSVRLAGAIDGPLVESGAGGVVIEPGGLISGNALGILAGLPDDPLPIMAAGDVTESGAGTLTVFGHAEGSAVEAEAGDLRIEPSGRIDGDAEERGEGRLYNYGSVGGTARED